MSIAGTFFASSQNQGMGEFKFKPHAQVSHRVTALRVPGWFPASIIFGINSVVGDSVAGVPLRDLA
jgi:hypothetical protein